MLGRSGGRFLARLAMHIGHSLPIFQTDIAFSRLCDAHPSEAGIKVAEEQGAESGSVPARARRSGFPTTNQYMRKCGSVGEAWSRLSLNPVPCQSNQVTVYFFFYSFGRCIRTVPGGVQHNLIVSRVRADDR